MDSVNVCLIGHRGVGKTTFLKRVTTRATFDLDAEIAAEAGCTIEQIFAAEGEVGFRRRECACLDRLLADRRPKVIAIGAGYSAARPDAHVIWLQRETDAAGRVFLDRPRLNPDVSPLTEYQERFAQRDRRFGEWADQILVVPEGYDGGLEDILDGPWRIPFDVTYRAGRKINIRPRRIEVRDDLTPNLNPDDLPSDVVILRAQRTQGVPSGDVDDWALELGSPPRSFAIVSVHEGQLDQAIKRLEYAPADVLKLAVEVTTFAELRRGHRWWLEDPNGRAFLPRSPSGRWRWYRSLFGPRMPIHFVREDVGTALDQPLLWQVRLQSEFDRTFAAVLGSPVDHSRTPLEQREFFASRRMPVVAIEVSEDEWTEAIPVLRELGLTHAAVTAPLKALAATACDDLTAEARRLGTVNTILFGERTRGANTDVIALNSLRGQLPEFKTPWLWGGGGVKPGVREAWPLITEISARAGVAEFATEPRPDLVIWATGRSRPFRWPPRWVRPDLVLDLNYSDDSPGLEWAAMHGLNYQSGLLMFKLQAEAQREFWRNCERGADLAWQSVW